MDFELTQKTTKLCKALKMPPEMLVFADLCSLGWEPSDAYILAYRKGSTWIRRALKEEVEKLLATQQVIDRIAENKQVLTERQKEAVKQTNKKERNSVVDTAMSKEQMLYDLQLAKAKSPAGSKEWIDINKLIVDVTRMKQDEVVGEENTIHHYLPVHYPTGCQDCLYQKCNTCKYKKYYEEKREE